MSRSRAKTSGDDGRRELEAEYLRLLSKLGPLPLKGDLTEKSAGRRSYADADDAGVFLYWERHPASSPHIEEHTLSAMKKIGAVLLAEDKVTADVLLKTIAKHGLGAIYHPLAFPVVFELARAAFWQRSDHDPRALHADVVSIVRGLRSAEDEPMRRRRLDELIQAAAECFAKSTWRSERRDLLSKRRSGKMKQSRFDWKIRKLNGDLRRACKIDGVENRLWRVLSRSFELRSRDYTCRTKQIVCSIVHAWVSSEAGGGPTVREIQGAWDRLNS